MATNLIGLGGKKGSGKNAVGDILHRDYGYELASFARLLKVSAAALLGIDPAEWERAKNDPHTTISFLRPGKKQVVLTAREFLQRYGTEAHREVFGQGFWIENLVNRLLPDHKYVITDSRFDNELKAVRAAGGTTVLIVRPGTDSEDTHASEAEPNLLLIDATLHNDGTLLDLDERVAQLVAWLPTVSPVSSPDVEIDYSQYPPGHAPGTPM